MTAEAKNTDSQDTKGATGDETLEGQNVHDLDEETLNSLAITDEGIIQKRPAESEDPASEETTGEEDKSGSKASEEGHDEDTTGEKDDEEGQKKTGDPLKDTQRAFHEERKKNLEAQQKIRNLEKQLREAKAPAKPAEYNLSKEDLEALRIDDPDRYVEVIEARTKYDQDKAKFEADMKAAEEAYVKELQEQAYASTLSAVVQFAEEVQGIKGRSGDSWDKQPQELKDFYASKEFQEIVDFVEKNPKKFYEEDGSISVETLRMIHRHLHYDDIAHSERRNGREEAIDSIRKAKEGGSKFGRVPKEASGKDKASGKTLDKLTQAEIHEMSEEELASYMREVDIEDEAEE